MVLFHTYTPAAPLSEFIENLWVYSFESRLVRERIFPSGTFEFVFNLRSDEIRIYKDEQSAEFQRYSGAIVSGPYAASFVTDTALEASAMGVHFRPGGAFPFLGADADELRDRHVDLEAIWGRSAAEIRERLCRASSPARRFRLLEEFLLARLLSRPQRHAAVALALGSLTRARFQMTRELASSAGLSEKRFIDLFRREVGLNPKLFTRICRFQRVLAGVDVSARPDWALVALDHGYFDQSHLIRDFLAFSGVSPADYVRYLDHLRGRSMRAKFNHLLLVQ